MRKAVTLPTTARDWKEAAPSASGTAQMKREREAKAGFGSATTSLLLNPLSQIVARCGNHSVQRSCSSACAALTAAPDFVASKNLQQQAPPCAVSNYDRVHYGWLFLASSASKRAFRWRFCVLDGAHLSYFRDNHPDAECLGHHVLVNVERLHWINRGLVLTDDKQRLIWAHANHETASFEEWLAVLRAGIQYERRRRDGSIFERSSIRASAASCSYPREHLDASFTGWLLLRRRRLGLFSTAKRHYVVLSGRHLSAFPVNLEGLRAKVCGRVIAAAAHKCSRWLAVTLESGQSLRLAATSSDVTVAWLGRMQRALEREKASFV